MCIHGTAMGLSWAFMTSQCLPRYCHGLSWVLLALSWHWYIWNCHGLPWQRLHFHDPAHYHGSDIGFQGLPMAAIVPPAIIVWPRAIMGCGVTTTGRLWIAMTIPWHCHEVAMALPWHCRALRGTPIPLPGALVGLPWALMGLQGPAISTTVPWHSHETAKAES